MRQLTGAERLDHTWATPPSCGFCGMPKILHFGAAKSPPKAWRLTSPILLTGLLNGLRAKPWEVTPILHQLCFRWRPQTPLLPSPSLWSSNARCHVQATDKVISNPSLPLPSPSPTYSSPDIAHTQLDDQDGLLPSTATPAPSSTSTMALGMGPTRPTLCLY